MVRWYSIFSPPCFPWAAVPREVAEDRRRRVLNDRWSAVQYAVETAPPLPIVTEAQKRAIEDADRKYWDDVERRTHESFLDQAKAWFGI